MAIKRAATIDDLEAVYRLRFPEFCRVAAAITGDESSGADAVHEAFVRAIGSRKSYRGDAPLEAWVWRIVTNAALTRRAKAGVEDWEGENDLVAASEPASSDELGLRAWVRALPERQRLAVFLRYFSDLDYRNIALVLDVEVGTISATLSAAHTSLRKKLEEVPR
jgi:RNA polymerase sigma factor (sigma-70 family)